MQLKKAAVVAAMCATMSVAGTTVAPSAYAEGNGGCYSYSNIDGNLSPRSPWLNLH
ncbi:hypothetical protein [Streptomyces sp. NPDC047024]|uniref:hypothetical protein n=1 Tax=Streptomyces sp. NPDC047024 TaxID=3155476 RepID=UPI0033FC6D26